ncbi:MAG: hypothetical protein GY747_08160 [Planctomycetes bacterium]|nr:hypothetical protein [Planctomycetota bacterium]MCP4771155.1 hypothetical protein [Planctomycetota bacterium]MCP4862118.1 hypothetical protein [Planctomycetota bacterium]
MKKFSPGAVAVLVAIALILLNSMAANVYYLLEVGTDELPKQGLRFLLTCALCREIYRRKTWARWLTVILLSVAAYLFIDQLGGLDVLSTLAFLNIVGFGLLNNIVVLILLLVGPGVGEYFSSQVEVVDEWETPEES